MKMLVVMGHPKGAYGRSNTVELARIRQNKHLELQIEARPGVPQDIAEGIRQRIFGRLSMPHLPIHYEVITSYKDAHGLTQTRHDRRPIYPTDNHYLEALIGDPFLWRVGCGMDIAGYEVHQGASYVADDEKKDPFDYSQKQLTVWGRPQDNRNSNVKEPLATIYWNKSYAVVEPEKPCHMALSKKLALMINARIKDTENPFFWFDKQVVIPYGPCGGVYKETLEPVLPGDEHFLEGIKNDPILWGIPGTIVIEEYVINMRDGYIHGPKSDLEPDAREDMRRYMDAEE